MTDQQTNLATDFDDFINKPEFKELEKLYNKPNLFKIIGKHRSETVHSAFWAWLLNPKESHGLGTEPLEKFIKIAIPNFKYEHSLNNVSVITESAIKGGRFDIFIDSDKTEKDHPFSIIIENKIDSNENEGQTQKYYKWSQEHNKNKDNYFVYMKPHSQNLDDIKLSVEQNEDKIFHKISYQKLYENVLLPFISSSSEIANKYINEYIFSFGISTQDSSHLIIINEEKELYTSIIENYLEQLDKMINSYGKDNIIESHPKINLFLNLLNFIDIMIVLILR
jgi:hypothetical protein